VASATAQTREEREREKKKRKERGKSPLFFPLGQTPREKERREKIKGAGVKERGPCHVHVPKLAEKSLSTSVEEK
jgi:hypothetical protein